jgi:1-acyl-sn-glycerol-3-phosphate acyltransferase
MLYRILRFIIGNGMRLYYREIKVKGKNALNQNGPMIIVANHPNTLIDAWIIAYYVKKPVYYLTKGTFFNNSFKKWILSQLYMIPINRPIDAKTSGVDNRNSFDACYEVLENGGTLVIFPEGNSMMENTLRDLKTGAARIALEVQKRHKTIEKIKICPVGFFYSKGHRFRSSVLANVGPSFSIEEYASKYLEAPAETSKTLTTKIRKAIENLIIGTDHQEQEIFIERILQALQTFKKFKNIEVKQQEYKMVKQRVQEFKIHEPSFYLELEAKLTKLEWAINHLKIHPKAIIEAKNESYLLRFLFRPLFLLIGFPIFIFGTLFHIFPFKLTQLLMPKMVATKEYYAPVAILIGLILYPLNYLAIFLIFSYYFLWSDIYLICSIPLIAASGIFAFHFSNYLKFVLSRSIFFISKKSDKAMLIEIEETVENLRNRIFTISIND